MIIRTFLVGTPAPGLRLNGIVEKTGNDNLGADLAFWLYVSTITINEGNEMPQQTVYIRKEDLPKWKALQNKSAFLSDALSKLPDEVNEQVTSPVKPLAEQDRINERARIMRDEFGE